MPEPGVRWQGARRLNPSSVVLTERFFTGQKVVFEASFPVREAALIASVQTTSKEIQGRYREVPSNMQNPLNLLPNGRENKSPRNFRRSPSPPNSLSQSVTENSILTPVASLDFPPSKARSPPLQVRFQEGEKAPTREEREERRTSSRKNTGEEVRITLLSAQVRNQRRGGSTSSAGVRVVWLG
jgi:hypothetical protein